MSVEHYENFPVDSILLPRRLHKPIHAVYAFARTTGDIADEGETADVERLRGLNDLQRELDRIHTGGVPQTALMKHSQNEAIKPFAMPLEPFYDLLPAFRQDVVKKRYQNFGELMNYCRHSANPVGRMMLHLHGENDPVSIVHSNGIYTALQLTNFWQDVALNWQKGRVYIPQEDLAKCKVLEEQIAEGRVDFAFQRLMAHEYECTFQILKAGSPLGKRLRDRIGFELRMIIVGGQITLQKLDGCKYDMFGYRSILGKEDWLIILKRAFLEK